MVGRRLEVADCARNGDGQDRTVVVAEDKQVDVVSNVYGSRVDGGSDHLIDNVIESVRDKHMKDRPVECGSLGEVQSVDPFFPVDRGLKGCDELAFALSVL